MTTNNAGKDEMRELRPAELERVSGGYNLGPTPVAPDDFAPLFCGEPMNANTACEILGGIYNDYRMAKSIESSIDFAAKRQVWQRMIL